MTFDNRFAVWRYPITELWVPAGRKGHRIVHVARPWEYYSFPLDLDDFRTGASDYDMSSDEAYCPCGETLRDWDGSAGGLLRMIYQHCGAYEHPRPVFDR